MAYSAEKSSPALAQDSGMTGRTTPPFEYDGFLNNLREQRDKIDQAITALEALRQSTASSIEESSQGGASLVGIPLSDAIRSILVDGVGPLKTSEIAMALLKRGYISESDTPQKVVAAQLHRSSRQASSGIVKAGRGLWCRARLKKPE